MKKNIVISLGGSLIAPSKIDKKFLQNFRKLILKNLSKYNFIIVTGGGNVARDFQKSGRELKISESGLDWLGIDVSRVNARLVYFLLEKYSNPDLLFEPKKVNFVYPINLAGGWKPGRSTDFVACELARKNNIKTVINLSNIDYAYNKDPKKFKSATKITETNWKDFQKIVGTKWHPGLNLPFDPIATKLAKKHKLEVVILNGRKTANISNFLANKAYKGTIIK